MKKSRIQHGIEKAYTGRIKRNINCGDQGKECCDTY